jgi:fucose 4-O-acetylase-like acetyltransferase
MSDSTPPTIPSARKREDWADYAKAIAIICVVIGHVLRGLKNGQIIEPSTLVEQIDNWLYTFMVPVFLFASGLFTKPLAPKDCAGFFKSKLLALGYPYVVWQTIQILIMLGTGGTNREATPRDLLLFPIQPLFHFWFLYVLVMVFAIYAAMSWLRIGRVWIALVFVSMLVWPRADWPPYIELLEYAIYFGLGLTCRPITERMRGLPVLALVGLSIICFAAMTALVATGHAFPTPMRPIGAVLGILGTIAVSMAIEKRAEIGALKLLGVYSLEIYLAHICFTAGCRIVLVKVLHLHNPAIHIVLGCLAGLLGPLILAILAKRYRVPLFRLR